MTIIVHGFSFAGIKPENFKKLYVSGIMIMTPLQKRVDEFYPNTLLKMGKP